MVKESEIYDSKGLKAKILKTQEISLHEQFADAIVCKHGAANYALSQRLRKEFSGRDSKIGRAKFGELG